MREPKSIYLHRQPKKGQILMRRHSPYARFKRLQQSTSASSSLWRTSINKVNRPSKAVKRRRSVSGRGNSKEQPPEFENVNLPCEPAADVDVRRGTSNVLSHFDQDVCDAEVLVSFNDGLDNVSHFSAPFEDSYYDEELQQYEMQLTDRSDGDEDSDADRPFYEVNGSNVVDEDPDELVADNDVDGVRSERENSSLMVSEDQSELADVLQFKSDCTDDRCEAEEVDQGVLAARQNCSFFKLSSKGSYLLVVEHPSAIPVLGKVSVRTLWGRANINGYVLEPDSDNSVPLWSMVSMGLLVIQTLAPPDVNDNGDDAAARWNIVQKRLLKYSSNVKIFDDIRKLSGDSTKNTVAMLFQNLKLPLYEYLHVLHRKLFERPNYFSSVVGTNSTLSSGFMLGMRASNDIRWDSCREDILKDVSEFTQNCGSPPRVLVCGGLKVGKSTFCRTFVNSLLNTCGKVSWFDCDPGQPEFTPPGMISVVEVNAPILGPSFTHQKTPNQMCFVGGTSVADSPCHYMACVTKLFDYWSHEPDLCQQPLLINTMGWIKGLGIMLLADIVCLMRPTHVVQIYSPTYKSKNMPRLTLKFAVQNGYLTSLHPPTTDDAGHSDFRHYSISSLVHVQLSIPKPFYLHDLAISSYFSQLHHRGRFVPLNECSCFSVPWSAIALHVCCQVVPKSDILYVLNGNLVALCECKPEEMVSTSDPTLPKFLEDVPVAECFGYGIVRAVSMTKKCVYVITPVPTRVLRRVNALLVGSGIHMPIGLLKLQTVQSHVPYLTVHKRTVPFAITNRHVKPRKLKRRLRKT